MGLETILALLVLVGAGIRSRPMSLLMQLEQPEREDEAEPQDERPAHVQVEDDGDATSAAPPATTPPQPSE